MRSRAAPLLPRRRRGEVIVCSAHSRASGNPVCHYALGPRWSLSPTSIGGGDERTGVNPSRLSCRIRSPSSRTRGEVHLLPRKIARHALPRRAFRRADIRRRRRENHLPRLPLLRMRHFRERALEAAVRIAAAGGVPPARFQSARAPELERVAIAPLLQRFLGGQALRIKLRRQLRFAYRFAQRIISVRLSLPPLAAGRGKTASFPRRGFFAPEFC